jgi:hypothetical protein
MASFPREATAMLFHVPELDFARDAARIAGAFAARDPAAIVVAGSAPGSLRVVARLDARGMLATLAEAGFAAIPEWQLGT